MPEYSKNVIKALSTLRVHAQYHSNPSSLRDAINVLDNAGVFVELDEQTGYDIDPDGRNGVGDQNQGITREAILSRRVNEL